jgi:ribosome-associated protein
MQQIDFPLRGEHIALDSLLKAIGAASSGAAAKLLVAEGRVQVDGRDEARKTAKIRAGQVVALQGWRIRVLAGAVHAVPAAPAAPAAPAQADEPGAPG